jgi:hypothetical protein
LAQPPSESFKRGPKLFSDCLEILRRILLWKGESRLLKHHENKASQPRHSFFRKHRYARQQNVLQWMKAGKGGWIVSAQNTAIHPPPAN